MEKVSRFSMEADQEYCGSILEVQVNKNCGYVIQKCFKNYFYHHNYNIIFFQCPHTNFMALAERGDKVKTYR